MRLLILTVIFVLAGPGFSDNLVVNGDFGSGDLTGWTEAGPATINGWLGSVPVPAQVFSNAAPMHIFEIAYSDRGARFIRRVGLASSATAENQWSLGWTRTGSPRMGYPSVSQLIRPAPGKYLVKAQWDVMAWHPRDVSEPLVGGLFKLNTDSDINSFALEGGAFSKTVWNYESKGRWMRQTVEGIPLETKSGCIEVRLQMYDKARDDLRMPDFEFIAFDNIIVELIPVGPADSGRSRQ